jgi:hypothetical protein
MEMDGESCAAEDISFATVLLDMLAEGVSGGGECLPFATVGLGSSK